MTWRNLAVAAATASVALGGAAPVLGKAADTTRPIADTAQLEAMRKAADALDEGADPAAYRKAWEAVIAYGRRLYPADHPEIAWLEGELVTADYLQGDIKGAAARADRLAEVLEQGGAAYRDRRMLLANAQVVILMTLSEHDRARRLAERVLEWRIASSGGTPSTNVSAAYSNLANAELEFGNYDRAISLVRKAIAENERLNPIPVNAAPHFANLPVYLMTSGRLEEGIEAARSTQQTLEKILPAGHPFLAINLNTLARIMLQLDRAAEAEETARKAVDIAVARFGQSQQTVNYLTTLAQALTMLGKTDEALATSKTAVDILTKSLGGEADRTLVARETYASALAAADKRVEALAHLDEVAAIRARKLPPFHRDRIAGADRRAALALRLGELGVARAAQESAQSLRRDRIPADDIAALVGEARLGAIEARTSATGPGLQRALAAATGLEEQLRRANAAGSRRSGRDREILTGFGWALDAALSASDATAGFRLAQRLTDSAAGRATQQAAARSVTDPDIAALIRAHQDAAVELETLRDRQLRLAGRGVDAETVRAVNAAFAATVERLAERTATLQARMPEFVAAQEARPLSLGQIQAALGPDEALLATAAGESRTAIFAVTRDRVVMQAASLDAQQVARLVKRLRASLSPVAVQAGAAFDFAASAELEAALLPQPVRAAIAGKRRVLIAASGPLAALPFATLAPRMTRPSLRSARWLIRDHALVTLPAIASVTLGKATFASRKVASFMAVGAPELAEKAAAGGVTPFRSANMARQVRDLPTLPATGPELRALGKALAAPNQRILIGAQATEAALRSENLGGVDVLAFATHGLTAGELDGLDEPALVLTPAGSDDGLLTTSEIMRLRLAAEWIILSACNTAAGGGTDSNGLAGLARAFLYAGGRNLLASHWAVRDDAAAYLSVQTLRRYGTGTDPAQALRRSMLQMIDARPIPGSDHPIHWAPFVFVGR